MTIVSRSKKCFGKNVVTIYIYAIPMLNEKKVYDRLYSPAKNVNLIQAHTVLWMLYVPCIPTQEGEKKTYAHHQYVLVIANYIKQMPM